ncbi:FAD-dependent monooxygenase [Xanthobacter sp. AM11]|uniref:FAD-dependent monooxygenase n=1 Tax=Xanthobacter sp. AM11 TaxID=3380643 RepID=UPI0039BF39CF
MGKGIDADVLIVGAGPIGLFSALLLARRGLRSIIVERHASPLQAPKAHVNSPRTLEIFRAEGLDVDLMRRSGTRPEDSRVIRFRASLKGREYSVIPYERQDEAVRELTPEPLANIPQPVLEKLLEDEVVREGRIQLRRRCSWRSVVQENGACRSVVEQDNDSSVVETRYLLGCDGAGSSVRSGLGIPMEGVAHVQSCLTIHFHANLRHVVGDGTAMIYWVINADVAGALIAHDIDSNWVFLRFDGLNPRDNQPTTAEEAHRIIRAAIGADAEFEIKRIVPWTMTAEVATSYRNGNVFLVGDAAHRFPPAGGLGLNTGIQDAHNLTWKLAAVDQGWASPELLDTYEAERRFVAQANSAQSLSNMLTAPRLALAMAAAAPYENEALPDHIAQELEQAIISNSVTFDCLGLHLGFSYDPDRPLPPAPNVYEPRAAAGDRLPHAWLGAAENGRSVLDLLATDKFTIFATGSGPQFADQVRECFGSVPVKVVEVDRELGLPGSWLALTGLDRPACLMVRPDGHVLAHVDGAGAQSLNALSNSVVKLCGAVSSKHLAQALA